MSLLKEILRESTNVSKVQSLKNWSKQYWKGVDPDMTEADVLRDFDKAIATGDMKAVMKLAKSYKKGSDRATTQKRIERSVQPGTWGSIICFDQRFEWENARSKHGVFSLKFLPTQFDL